MEEQEEGKSHQNAVKDYWLSSGIVVKVRGGGSSFVFKLSDLVSFLTSSSFIRSVLWGF